MSGFGPSFVPNALKLFVLVVLRRIYVEFSLDRYYELSVNRRRAGDMACQT